MRPRAGAGPALGLGVLLAACVGHDPPAADTTLYPLASTAGGATRLEFGPGRLQTTSDEQWGGTASVVYPVAVDGDAGPVEIEIHGLDLSEIEYGGDMGWPPDPSDTGALVQAGVRGSGDITYRIWSTVEEALSAAEGRGPQARPPSDFRSYLFQGFNGGAGAYGVHQMALEPWGPAGDRAPYNTVDLRLRYESGRVDTWVRLHASRDWEEGGRGRGASCPWNIAMNSAVPGTEDSVWSGECRVLEPGETGQAVGAWVGVASGPWNVTARPSSVQAALSISNWENAEGPYRVSWQNVILRGQTDSRVPSAVGTGRLRAFGTGDSEIDPRGEWGDFSFLANEQGPGVRQASLVRYRSADLEMRSERTDWVLTTPSEVQVAGEARVNGNPGFRYELLATTAEGNEPSRFSLELWESRSPTRAYYAAFGPLAEGSVLIRPRREP